MYKRCELTIFILPHNHPQPLWLEEPSGVRGLGVGMHRWTTATHPRQAPRDPHHTPIPHHPRCQLSCVSGVIQTFGKKRNKTQDKIKPLN